MKLRVVNVALVMTDGPFGGLLGPDRIGPPEPYDTGTDGDAEPSGFGLGAATLSADVRPTAAALLPCGLAASGARDLPSTEAPAEPGSKGGCSDADVAPFVDGVESVADDAMLRNGVPAPRRPDAAHNASGGAEAPGQERMHRVRFMSVRRTD